MSKKTAISSKFNSDLIWNIGGFGLSAAIGLLLNFAIISVYNAEALGVFNQIYAVYILLSQLAVGGVHLAVQKFVPEYFGNTGKRTAVVLSALLLSTISSVLVMLLAAVFSHLPGLWSSSQGVSDGFVYVIWGLLFFSWNKVLMAFLNGIRQMKAYAIFQFLRFFFMLLFFGFAVVQQLSTHLLCVMLPVAELALFIPLSIYSLKHLSPKSLLGFGDSFKANFHFGNSALLGNFLLDVNTKVDIIMLGYFLNDSMVGVYSIAATVAEGLMLFPGLLRNNINPIITKAFYAKNADLLNKILAKSRRNFFKIGAGLSVLSILAFPAALLVFGIEQDFYLAWQVYGILALGIMLASGYLPFLMFFNQIGQPAKQTLLIGIYFTANVVLNAAFIPLFGVYGAAIGTSLSLAVFIAGLKLGVSRFSSGKLTI